MLTVHLKTPKRMTINQFSELDKETKQSFLETLNSLKNPPVWALQFRHALKNKVPSLVSFNQKLSQSYSQLTQTI